jgi:hypothetical protein
MPSWLPHRRARIERTDAEAEELIREFCDDAYLEAIRRENEASSDAIAKDWSRVALAVAHKLKTSTGVDPTTRIAMNALFVPDRKPATVRLPRGHSERSRVDEAKRTLSAKPQRFRIQFVCAAVERGALTLKEAPIEAADVSAAIVTAAKTPWPERTIALRILDRDGREVFARQRTSVNVEAKMTPRPDRANGLPR